MLSARCIPVTLYHCHRSVVHSPEQALLVRFVKENLTLKVLVATVDAQWEGMGDVGSARYDPALLPPCLTIRVLSYNK